MENGPFEDVFPIKIDDLPLLCWFTRGYFISQYNLGSVQLVIFGSGFGSHGMKITILHHYWGAYVWVTFSKHLQPANPGTKKLFFFLLGGEVKKLPRLYEEK